MRTRPLEQRLAELAERQHGRVSHHQVRELGLSERAIARWVERGRLHREHRAVYAVGHRVSTPHAYWMGAVLAGGDGAVLSHRAAGALWRLRRWSGAAEVTLRRQLRSRPGLIFHCSALPDDEITEEDGIPVTTAPRTLLDLATILHRHDLERAIHQAEYRRLWHSPSLPELLERYPRRAGTVAIREILAAGRIGLDVPNEGLEEVFIPFLDSHGIPRPRLNVRVHVAGRWYELDCVWHEQRLVVELDGRRAHQTADAFESDRVRDRLLTAAGWRVIRITWRQLHQDPASVARDLHALLVRAG